MMLNLEAPSFQRFNADGSLLSAGSTRVDIKRSHIRPSQSYAGAAAVSICSIVFMLLVLYVMLKDCRFEPVTKLFSFSVVSVF